MCKILPLWHRNLRLLGSASSSSLSILPVTPAESNVRYATETPSRAPDLHSAMKSCLLAAFGWRTCAMSEMVDHATWALESDWFVLLAMAFLFFLVM